jgi:transposase
MTTYQLPALTDVEWRRIALVIPRPKAGQPPRHDRQIVSALCYSQAAGCSFERLPPGYPRPGSVRVRVQRWQQYGVLAAILDKAAPAIKRMHADYRARLSDLSPWGGDWQFNRDKDDKAFANLPRR